MFQGSGGFGTGTTSTFGSFNKPATSFGASPTVFGSGGSSLFGSSTQPSTSGLFVATTQAPAFGQPQTTNSSYGGFGSTMGASINTGTAAAKFVPVTEFDSTIKYGVRLTIITRFHCISCMKEYESKSLEELRLEDYVANRKGPQQRVQPSELFGSTAQPSLFGAGANTSATPGTGLFGAAENKPLFGNTSTPIGFGQTSNVFGNTGTSLFGKPATATPAFGTPTTTNTNTFAFNSPTIANPFGSNMAQVKPFGTIQPSMFSAPTSQPATGFGTQTSAFGSTFGTPATQTSGGLFSQNKPTFGTNNNQFSFGQTATTSTGTSLFGAKPTNTFGSPFGTTTSNANTGFGTTSTFGTTNQNTSLFGNSFKAPTTNFSFGPTSTANPSLGGASSLFGNTANKPTSLFGSTNTGMELFGSTGFGTGNTSFGTTTNTGLGMNMPMGSLLGGLVPYESTLCMFLKIHLVLYN